jgi:hypothetical protein
MKQIAIFIGFILFCIAGLAGIPSWPKIETSVGYFKISKNPYGVAMYQDGKYASVEFENATSFAVNGNTITISSASAVMYSRDDIIFDTTSIFTDPPQEQIGYLRRSKTDTSVLPNTVYLINPHIPGVLELQGTNMRLDKESKKIYGSVPSVIVHDNL